MFPILIQLGPLTLHTYGLFVALGVIVGTQMSIYWARRNGVLDESAQDMFYSLTFYTLIAGLFGARFLYVVTFREQFSEDWLSIFKVWQGGLVFYGGFIGGAIGFLIWQRRYPAISWRKVADWACPSLAFGHALGRLGCFSAGCCHGRPTASHWAVTFTDPNALAPLGIPLHPTQLYEFLFLTVIGAYSWRRNGREHADGSIFADYIILYSIGRFVVEFFRGDPSPTRFLTPAQIVSAVLFIFAIAFRSKIKNPSGA